MSSAEVSLEEGGVRSGQELEGGASRQRQDNLSSRKAVCDKGINCFGPLIPSPAPHSNTGCAQCSPTSAMPPVFGIMKVTPSRVSLNPAMPAWVKGAVICLLCRQVNI